MKDVSKEMSRRSRLYWGDKLVCRIILQDGVQVAKCQYNGVEFIGRGKNNFGAIRAVFSKINNKKNE